MNRLYIRKKYDRNHRNPIFREEEKTVEQFAKEGEEDHIIIAQDIKKVFDEKLVRDTGRGNIYNPNSRNT